MDTYTVTPLPDGVDQKRSWQLKKNRVRVKPYTLKQTAIDDAYDRGSKGDKLVIVGTNGEIQDQRIMQGGNTESDDTTMRDGMPWGEKWAKRSAEKSTGFDWL